MSPKLFSSQTLSIHIPKSDDEAKTTFKNPELADALIGLNVTCMVFIM